MSNPDSNPDTKPDTPTPPVGQVRQLGPDWLQKYVAGKKNVTVYDITHDTVDKVPARTVVARLNEITELLAAQRKEHPDWTVGDHRRHLLREYAHLKEFYKTHKTFFLTITRPDLSMQEAREMYHLCFLHQQRDDGKITQKELNKLVADYLGGGHLKPLTVEQQLEIKRTGRIPDEVFDRKKASYMLDRVKLTVKDEETGEVREVDGRGRVVTPAAAASSDSVDADINVDGEANRLFRTNTELEKEASRQDADAEATALPPAQKPSQKRLREQQRKEARRQRVIQHQQGASKK